jgi:hypothetical protein
MARDGGKKAFLTISTGFYMFSDVSVGDSWASRLENSAFSSSKAPDLPVKWEM